MTSGQRIVDAFLAGDAAAVTGALAADGTFHSPVADYRGRDRYAPVLTAVTQVVGDASATSVVERDGETVAFFTATVEGRPGEGVLRVVGDTDLTLMVRPLGTLLAGVERMKALLPR
jgi:SnoaL-like domain